MKKLLLIGIMALAGLNVSAQEDGKEWAKKLHAEFKVSYGLKQHDMTPINANTRLSYDILKRVSISGAFEKNWMLVKAEGSKHYADGMSVGGGVGYMFAVDDGYNVEARLQVLTSVGKTDWKYTTYEAGVMFYLTPNHRQLAPVVGGGYRLEKSRTDGVRNWGSIFGTFGLRF